MPWVENIILRNKVVQLSNEITKFFFELVAIGLCFHYQYLITENNTNYVFLVYDMNLTYSWINGAVYISLRKSRVTGSCLESPFCFADTYTVLSKILPC